MNGGFDDIITRGIEVHKHYQKRKQNNDQL
jgi:hypothetical protein